MSRGLPDRRVVALTFDAGADVGFAAHILDTLSAETVRATFGITGRWAEQHPELVRRMAAAGHLVMNHSYEHRSFTGPSARPAVVSPAKRRADVERADEVIRALTGAPPGPGSAPRTATTTARSTPASAPWATATTVLGPSTHSAGAA